MEANPLDHHKGVYKNRKGQVADDVVDENVVNFVDGVVVEDVEDVENVDVENVVDIGNVVDYENVVD